MIEPLLRPRVAVAALALSLSFLLLSSPAFASVSSGGGVIDAPRSGASVSVACADTSCRSSVVASISHPALVVSTTFRLVVTNKDPRTFAGYPSPTWTTLTAAGNGTQSASVDGVGAAGSTAETSTLNSYTVLAAPGEWRYAMVIEFKGVGSVVNPVAVVLDRQYVAPTTPPTTTTPPPTTTTTSPTPDPTTTTTTPPPTTTTTSPTSDPTTTTPPTTDPTTPPTTTEPAPTGDVVRLADDQFEALIVAGVMVVFLLAARVGLLVLRDGR